MKKDTDLGGGTSRRDVLKTLGGAAAHRLTGQRNSDIEDGRVKPGAPPAQLYDLDADPAEGTNRYLDAPQVVQELQALLAQVRKGRTNGGSR